MRAHSGVHSPQRIQESKQAGEPPGQQEGRSGLMRVASPCQGGLASHEAAACSHLCALWRFAASWPTTCTGPVLDPGYGEIFTLNK